MSYKSPEFWTLERNVAKHKAILNHIENARTFNRLKYAEQLNLNGRIRMDDATVSIEVSGDLMRAVLDLCAERSIAAAKTIYDGEWEKNDFEKAAKV